MCVQLDYFNHLLHRMDVLPVPAEHREHLHESGFVRRQGSHAKSSVHKLCHAKNTTRPRTRWYIPAFFAAHPTDRTGCPTDPDGWRLDYRGSSITTTTTSTCHSHLLPSLAITGLSIGSSNSRFLRQFGPQFTGTNRPQNWFYSRNNNNNNNNEHHNTYNARLSKLMQEKTRNAPPERGHRCGRTESDNAKTRRRTRHNTRTKKAAEAC
uniref:Uncharacterized protein 22J3.1 n=1 Tax=Anopheles gambiae TaxID=7165 RepID=Q8T5H7_ANOGA|nr:hypothetical protein [Anopheles gambiae]